MNHYEGRTTTTPLRPWRRVAIAVLTIGAVSLAAAPPGWPAERAEIRASSTLSSTTEDVCDALRKPGVTFIGEKILTAVTRGRYKGGFASSLVIRIVKKNCEELLSTALVAVKTLLGEAPDQIQIATLPTMKNLLPRPTSGALLAAALAPRFPLVTAGQIDALVQDLCDDVIGVRASDPATDFGALFPRADLQELRSANQIAALVLSRCRGLTAYGADGLISRLTGYLIANQGLVGSSDVVPPVAIGPTWAHFDADTIQVFWDGYDTNGFVSSYDLWVLAGGSWIELNRQTQERMTFVNNLSPSLDYQFALRAVDSAGNASGWVYMRPCLTCP